MHEIIQGDCLEVMKTFPDNHFSALVTDPPYGLKFMGKEWDHGIPGISFWEEALRISKPGSHLLAFGGTRTYHRLACAIEEAGWEIRDCLMWIYGSGFPKSHNHFGIEKYGTALKPAYEPIIMAMKPLDGTFKQNAEKWGQAGINVDGCRIEWKPRTTHSDGNYKGHDQDDAIYNLGLKEGHFTPGAKGRWPANVLFDEEAAAILDEQSGNLAAATIRKWKNSYNSNEVLQHGLNPIEISGGRNDSGGASRFFYCAKSSSRERNEGLSKRCTHPTVKPLKLMEYLIKLVMPPSNGLLLDPFAGSGSTILAAKRMGFDAIGIEKEAEYCEIAKARLAYVEKASIGAQIEMFG